jgi:hypothetical protein
MRNEIEGVTLLASSLSRLDWGRFAQDRQSNQLGGTLGGWVPGIAPGTLESVRTESSFSLRIGSGIRDMSGQRV